MIPSSRWPLASNRQAATATPRFDEAKIGEGAAITRPVSCMINLITTLPITLCHWALPSSSTIDRHHYECGGMITMAPTVYYHYMIPDKPTYCC